MRKSCIYRYPATGKKAGFTPIDIRARGRGRAKSGRCPTADAEIERAKRYGRAAKVDLTIARLRARLARLRAL